MERLTFEVHDGGIFVKESDVKTFTVEDEILHTGNAVRKLAEYEELEEQGKLLKLPCAVGDTVYRIIKEFRTGKKKIISGKVYRIALTDTEMQIFINEWQSKGIFGKTVFLTQKEAEAALKGEHKE